MLKQVHRCIKFKQSNWLEPWITFNTRQRIDSTNNFHEDVFKLMNNAVVGKCMENVRSHVDCKLVNDIKRLEKCLNSPTFKHQHFIDDNLLGIEK